MDADDVGGDESEFEESPPSEGMDDPVEGVERITLTPEEHQQLKDLINGDEMERIKGVERRYLVVGAGGESEAAERRTMVYTQLDGRTDPNAVAMRLEDFGLTRDEMRLWTRVFDILCGRATHVVGVYEDFDGGYVWELGLLWAPSYREKAWILKRRYENDTTEREQFDNGMAYSHVQVLLTSDRCIEWVDVETLRAAVREVP